MKGLLLLITVIIPFGLQAQSYIPKHSGVYPKASERVPLEEVIIKQTGNPIEVFSKKPIDTLLIDETVLCDKYGVKFSEKARKNRIRISKRAYWQSKRKGMLFQTAMQMETLKYLQGIYKEDEPYWLSLKNAIEYRNRIWATGIIEKRGKRYEQWTRKKAIRRLTPITTPKEAVVFLFLMENAFPINDFSDIKNPMKIEVNWSGEKEEIDAYYEVYVPELRPTEVIEEKGSFIVNLFYKISVEDLYEVVYRLFKNGHYEVLSKRLIYKMPLNDIGEVF